MILDEALDEQLAYYRARAGEYDEWFQRRGRYDRGPAENYRWFDEVEEVRDALARVHRRDTALELACGTGIWTERLAASSRRVTAVDASPEVLAINRSKLHEAGLLDRVDYREADLFTWRPETRYDLVFFGFWLSHVPPDRFESFFELVADCLAPGGRVFFVDNLYTGESTAKDHRLRTAVDTTVTRKLNDGREFEIVKVFYHADELAARLGRLGFEVAVETTGKYFLCGSGTRR